MAAHDKIDIVKAISEMTRKNFIIPEDIKSEGAKSSWKKLKESKQNVEKERDTIREQFWAAFDAFVPSAVTSKLGEPVVA